MRSSRFPGVVCIVAAAVCGAGAVYADPVDLDNLPARLPFVSLPNPLPRGTAASGLVPEAIFCDLDRDGWDEMVSSIETGVLAHDLNRETPGVIWQWNVPPEYAGGPHAVWLGFAHDVSGDGRPEIWMTAYRRDDTAWRLWAFDAAAQRLVINVALPAADELEPGSRGRHWLCLGALERTAVEGAPAIVLLRLDGERGAVLACDPATGDAIWSRELPGVSDPDGCRLMDVDRDDLTDIIVTTADPGALTNAPPVAGSPGYRCQLLLLNARGETRWVQDLGSDARRAWSRAADLDGDGNMEIVTATTPGEPGGRGMLAVRNVTDGAAMAEKSLPSGALGLEILQGARAGSIYVGLLGGGLNRYRYDAGRLAVADRALSTKSVKIAALVDLFADVPGPELLALTAAGRAAVLAPDLAPLCAFSAPHAGLTWVRGMVWNAGPASRYLYVEAAQRKGYLFRRQETLGERVARVWNTQPMPAKAALGVAALGIPALAAVVLRRRVTRARADDPELWARLLRELQVADHGAVAVTKALNRRLLPLLEQLGTDPPQREALVERVRDAWETQRGRALPRIGEILRLANNARVEPVAARDVGAALVEATTTLERLFAANLVAGEIVAALPQLKRAGTRIETGLQTIRSRAVARFRVDARAVLDQALAAREEELRGAAVRVVVEPEVGRDAVFVAMRPDELLFILDNLVGNAARAMAGAASPRRELRCRLATVANAVDIVVSDSGPGVLPVLREAIFTAHSTRPGGGVGLFRGRECARRWGGDLALEETAPGDGATFRLTLAAVPTAGDTTNV